MVVFPLLMAQQKAVKQSSSRAGMQLEVSLERLSVISYEGVAFRIAPVSIWVQLGNYRCTKFWLLDWRQALPTVT